MAVVPYMPLYVADYLGDTSHLSTLEHGAYLLLILNYWQRGKALPATNERLANVARLSNEEWLNVRPTLAEFFHEKDGLWFQKRLEKELEHFREVSNHNRIGGIASGVSRRKKRQNQSNERSANVERTRNQTDADADADERRVLVVNDLKFSPEVLTDVRTKPNHVNGNGNGASVRPSPQSQILSELTSLIFGYMCMEGTQYQRKAKPPDDRIVLRCYGAIAGAPLSEVGAFLRDRFLNHEQAPIHPNGPKSYAWFPAVLADRFGGPPK